MALTRVTITGADDATKPIDLVLLSRAFPFVEWGVLYSTERLGQARFPSLSWRVRLHAMLAELPASERPRMALHLCGRATRDVLEGDTDLLGLLDDYQRVQLNGWRPSPMFHPVARYHDREFILQVRAADQLQAAASEERAIMGDDDAQRSGTVSALWDCSGGRGVTPPFWPLAPGSLRLGYAGGIRPDNVVAVLDALGDRPDFWIDMETGVRTDDRLDLDKVRAVLTAAEPYVKAAP